MKLPSFGNDRPTWCLPTVLQKCFLFCFPPWALDGGRWSLRKEGKKSSCFCKCIVQESCSYSTFGRSRIFPDVFLDWCRCCLDTTGETTGNVQGSFLRCHGNCQGGGSVLLTGIEMRSLEVRERSDIYIYICIHIYIKSAHSVLLPANREPSLTLKSWIHCMDRKWNIAHPPAKTRRLSSRASSDSIWGLMCPHQTFIFSKASVGGKGWQVGYYFPLKIMC